jgi:site-specific DNA-cytosine methylase
MWVQVLARHHPRLRVHSDLNSLDLVSAIPEGTRLDVVVISTPCTDVSVRGKGKAQLGEESNLFFVAIDKVEAYARITGHWPHIISENVAGRRLRRRDQTGVRMMYLEQNYEC